MLHVLNGDATAAVFAGAGVPGNVLVWRDILAEGPVTSEDHALATRAAFLAERLGLDREDYLRGAREQADGLAAAFRHDEVVLWFEQDLFCAVNLWFLLGWFARRPAAVLVSLVYPPTDEIEGLGALEPPQLGALFPERQLVMTETVTLGRQAWNAYASADPLACEAVAERESPALPFVRGAFRCHLGRFPSVANGLNEVEMAALTALSRGPRDFGALFREVGADPRVRRHGMGDLQFAACVRGLTPLVSFSGADVTTAEIAITPLGHEVLAGARDWLDVRPIDTWLGGVRLAGNRSRWRWDGARGHLVTAPP